jgi:DNA-binding NtrC family response regulator
MRILVVEDNYLIAMELENILRAAGHEVVGPFAAPEQAVEALVRETVDGALLDFRVGEGNSTAIAAELVRRGCPFAFVTGSTGAATIPSSFAEVARIGKPFGEADILRALARFGASRVEP